MPARVHATVQAAQIRRYRSNAPVKRTESVAAASGVPHHSPTCAAMLQWGSAAARYNDSRKKKNSVLGLPLGAAAARIFTQTQTGAALPQGPTRSQAPSRCILLRGPGPASDSDGASLPTTASAPGTGHRVQDRHERRHLMICTSGCLSLASWTPLLVLQIVQIVPHSSNCS